MKTKTRTGALPHSAGFPGTNMVVPRLHPAIIYISFTDLELVPTINKMVTNALKHPGLRKGSPKP